MFYLARCRFAKRAGLVQREMVITPALQKIQFASSGQITLNRPDMLRIRRTGGYAEVELVFDGKTLSLYGKDSKS